MESFVEVSGTGVAQAEPDVVRIVATASATWDTMREAADAVAAAAGALRTALGAAGIEGKDARTQALRFEPEWRQEGQPQRYAARQTVAVTSRDVAGAGALVTSMVEAVGDALIIESLSFEKADAQAVALAAREEAFADALAKAEHYAALAGRSLLRVVAVTEGPVGGTAPLVREAKFAADAASAQPLEAGGVEVRASVTVRWALG